ncbi:MAG: hypothetical protein HYX24_03530 [Candidatus Aenigmarchaeota archaeon]|nr:hypothetical protein [Candidatus Aenigmarchaeota archaeon]
MADQINPKRAAMTVGIFAAVLHFLWAIIVASGTGQQLADWKLGLHFLSNPYTIASFNIVTAVALIAAAFVGGAVLGWALAAVWNWTSKFK